MLAYKKFYSKEKTEKNTWQCLQRNKPDPGYSILGNEILNMNKNVFLACL